MSEELPGPLALSANKVIPGWRGLKLLGPSSDRAQRYKQIWGSHPGHKGRWVPTWIDLPQMVSFQKQAVGTQHRPWARERERGERSIRGRWWVSVRSEISARYAKGQRASLEHSPTRGTDILKAQTQGVIRQFKGENKKLQFAQFLFYPNITDLFKQSSTSPPPKILSCLCKQCKLPHPKQSDTCWL